MISGAFGARVPSEVRRNRDQERNQGDNSQDMNQMMARWLSGVVSLLLFGTTARAAQQVGVVDPAFKFAPAASSDGRNFAVAPDGKIIVAGLFSQYHGAVRKGVARLNADGTLDPEFDPQAGSGGAAGISGVTVLNDGRPVIAGSFTTWNGTPHQYMVRLDLHGAVDPTFNASYALNGPLVALPNNQLLVCGRASDYGTKTGIIRLNENGDRDPGFADAELGTAAGLDFPTTTIIRMARQPDQRLVVVFAGLKSSALKYGVARLTENGAFDPSFHIGLVESAGTPQAVAIDSNNRILVGGNVTKYDGKTVGNLFRLAADGTVDTAFVFPASGSGVNGIAPMADGRVIVTGSFTKMTTPVIRLKADGTLDPNYGLVADNPFGQILVSILSNPVVLPDGSALVSGLLYVLQGATSQSPNGVVRLTGDNGSGGGGGGNNPPPTITTPLLSQSVLYGTNVTFSVVASSLDPMTYQWLFNGKELAGATNTSLILTGVSSANQGEYKVRVTNPNGSTLSNPAQLKVDSTPRITAQPADLEAAAGAPAQLVAGVSGEPPIGFQWYRNENPVPGGNAAVLAFPQAGPGDEGTYGLIATNGFGSVTSLVAHVTVYNVCNDWLTFFDPNLRRTNAGQVVVPVNPVPTLIATRGKSGVALLSGRGVERRDDCGTRLWTADFIFSSQGSIEKITMDRFGNTYVYGTLQITATLGDLTIDNTSADKPVSGFVAKLDRQGHGLWYRLLEGITAWALDVDPMDDSLVLAGVATSRNDEIRIGTLRARRYTASEGIAAKIGADGTPAWLRTFPQVDAQVSTCEADAIAADETGIYLTGMYSFSIAFGSFQLHRTGTSPAYWMGKLDHNGNAQWIKQVDGTAQQFAPLAAAAGRIWFTPDFGRSLQRWTPDGVRATNFIAGASLVNNNNYRATQLGVTTNGSPILIGQSLGSVVIGTNQLNVGAQRAIIWFGQWDNQDNFIRGRLLAQTTRDVVGANPSSLSLTSWAASGAGDIYIAGSTGQEVDVLTGHVAVFNAGFVGKQHAPGYLPEVKFPYPSLGGDWDSFRAIQFGVTGIGPEPLSYQWRRNGVPIPGANTNVFNLAAPLPADNGDYDCIVSNPYGSVISTPATHLVVRPPISFSRQPEGQLVILNGALEGTNLLSTDVTAATLSGKTLHCVITNSSGAWPRSGAFDLNIPTLASYEIPPAGVLGFHVGGLQTLGLPGELTLHLLRYQGLDMATMGVFALGYFNLHLDIADPSGCCAEGTYTLTGGALSARFQVFVNGALPADLGFQWQKNGIDLPGATGQSLDFPAPTAADNGLYRCLVTYKGYTMTSSDAPLRVVDGTNGGVDPLVTFATAPDGKSLNLSWPAGYVLQQATALAGPWVDLALTSPTTIQAAQQIGFFRAIKR